MFEVCLVSCRPKLPSRSASIISVSPTKVLSPPGTPGSCIFLYALLISYFTHEFKQEWRAEVREKNRLPLCTQVQAVHLGSVGDLEESEVEGMLRSQATEEIGALPNKRWDRIVRGVCWLLREVPSTRYLKISWNWKLTKKQAEKTKFKSKSIEATLKATTQVTAEVVQEECTQEFHSMLASIGIATSRRSVETRKGKFSSFIQRAFGQIKVLTPAEAQRRLHVWMDIEEDPVNGQRFQSANWRKQRLYKLKCGSEPSGDDPEAITNLESIRFIREFLLSE